MPKRAKKNGKTAKSSAEIVSITGKQSKKKQGKGPTIAGVLKKLGLKIEIIGMEKLDDAIIAAPPEKTRRSPQYLIDSYYRLQSNRKIIGQQIKATESVNGKDPLLCWFHQLFLKLEEGLKDRFKTWIECRGANTPAQWARTIPGVDVVFAAGFAAMIDIERAPTPSALWRFAGMDPSQQWIGRDSAEDLVKEVVGGRGAPTSEQIAECAARVNVRPGNLRRQMRIYGELSKADSKDGGYNRKNLIRALARRPWNADLKVLRWKLGQEFMFHGNDPDCPYGLIYTERKLYEIERNKRGDNKELAAKILASKKWKKGTPSRKAYEKGMLPDAQITARACRYAAKMFLGDWWKVAYELRYGKKAPRAYPIEHLGHVHERKVGEAF
jgi:hypothetical protein